MEELVLKGKLDIEEPLGEVWFNCTRLHLAAYSGYTSCFETLVKLGANIDATDSDGWSTLDLVLGLSRFVEAMSMLVAVGYVNLRREKMVAKVENAKACHTAPRIKSKSAR